MLRLITCLAALASATPASAETFSVRLGGKTLGEMRFDVQGKASTLRSTLDSTPMGVFNGTFSGTSTGSASNSRFTGESRSSRKQRDVTVEIAKGSATNTVITPTDELTELSDVARVPAGVMDPVRVIGALVRAGGCPDRMKMYDGRRVVTLSTDGRSAEGDVLICTMNYRVSAGPGHLSPLRISSAKLTMRYDTSGGQQSLRQMQVSSGIFRVSLDRIN